MKHLVALAVIAVAIAATLAACDTPTLSTEMDQAKQQAQSLEQAHAEVGMPAISQWQEKRMVKDLYELRDKAIATHTYIVSEMRGCLVYLGPSIGYGLPYGTQYTAPSRYGTIYSGSGLYSLPQPEPNGLYVPETAEGTWVMLQNPTSTDGKPDVKPVYVEPRVLVSPFRLPDQECKPDAPPAPKAR